MPELNIATPENTMQVFIVRRSTPAMEAFLNLTKHKARNGEIFLVSDEEFESIKKDVLCLEIET